MTQQLQHPFRTHSCGDLTTENVSETVKLSGWVHRKRDHGHLLFIDLRDHYGITQLLFDDNNKLRSYANNIPNESVITITGKVIKRTKETINNDLPTGKIEVGVETLHIESEADPLPLQVNTDSDYGEDIRLKYRYLDLRREKIHNNIILRSSVINLMRQEMLAQGFMEFQTPILTSTSPEGARDFLVPSRMHPGKFYALPQAPQIFKQLIMTSGFDKYFQIAPCFRDEDSRADRSPGEFYQLDVEMSFVTQEDVFASIEPVIHKIFTTYGNKSTSDTPFQRITYAEAMLKYGCDKPDLRNPILISDVTEIFRDSDFTIFASNINKGAIARAIPAPGTADKPRSFFDKMISFAQGQGAKGLAYIIFDEKGEAKGPIAKFLSSEKLIKLRAVSGLNNGDAVFLSCDQELEAARIAGLVRNHLGQELDLIANDRFELCWVTDYPYFELDEDTGKPQFSHNPFSMPQGGMEALKNADTVDKLLSIKAYQYDLVCNGIELCSGAIRNHKPEILYKAFQILGFSKEYVDNHFGALAKAFKYGAPPHGGIAPGIDRIIMLLADEPNIREVILFPMNQKAEDIMMQAPSAADDKQLKELHISLSNVGKKLEKQKK